MTSPTVNSVGITTFDPLVTGSGRFVSAGVKWGGALGTGVTLDFSFHGTYSAYAPGYPYGEPGGAYGLSSGEKAAVRSALAVWSRVADVSFHEVTDSATVAGDLRFAYVNQGSSTEAAHAYYPATDPSAGDVWFDWYNFNPNSTPTISGGSYDFFAIVHEIGHALGLKHSFETPNAASAAQDNFLWSVMSYTASPWSLDGDNYASFYPTTPMYLDLVAIQGMYGRRAHGAGNNTYTFVDGHRYWQAIDDVSGTDTILYNGVENSSINLNPATFSSLSERIFFSGGSTRATVTIGPGTSIENARGGGGNDTLIGNAANNNLQGANGNDTLIGYTGNDYVVGGAGNDKMNGVLGNDSLTGGANSDTFKFSSAPNSTTNHDKILDYSPAQDRFELDNAVFAKLGGVGALNSAFFRAAAQALDRNDYLVYNRTTGDLSYDSNGNGPGGAIVFATLTTKPVLTAGEFFII